MTKRIVAKVDEYEKEGQIKGKYVEIGVILSNDNGEYMLLDPAVNLAGVLTKQNFLARKQQKQARDNVMCSIFDNSNQGGGYQQQAQQTQQPQRQQQQNHQYQQNQSQQPQYNNIPQEFDDTDIPF